MDDPSVSEVLLGDLTAAPPVVPERVEEVQRVASIVMVYDGVGRVLELPSDPGELEAQSDILASGFADFLIKAADIEQGPAQVAAIRAHQVQPRGRRLQDPVERVVPGHDVSPNGEDLP